MQMSKRLTTYMAAYKTMVCGKQHTQVVKVWHGSSQDTTIGLGLWVAMECKSKSIKTTQTSFTLAISLETTSGSTVRQRSALISNPNTSWARHRCGSIGKHRSYCLHTTMTSCILEVTNSTDHSIVGMNGQRFQRI